MTNAEAIEVLSEIYMHCTVDSLEATIMVERHNKALDMAIKALKAQDMTLYMNLPEVSAEEVIKILKQNNRVELLPSGKDTNVPSTDLISRQTVLKLFATHDGKHLYEAIQTLPSAQPEQRWIPCSERLPEEYGNYLVTTDDGDVDIGTIDTDSKKWNACDANGFFWLRKVIAWMPLPESYRGEHDGQTD